MSLPDPITQTTVTPFVPMDTNVASDTNAMFSMSAFTSEEESTMPANFSAAVNQVMAGLDPVPRATAPTVTTTAPLTVPPPASRKRGLAYAQLVKTRAREDFKERRRIELEQIGEGDRTKRRKKNDTSMTERQKYRRRLQKNQDSAAAARYAHDAYIANLEEQVGRYDADMNAMCAKLRRIEAERDEYMRISQMSLETNKHLEIQMAYLRENAAAAGAAQVAVPPTSQCTPQENAQEWKEDASEELEFKNTMFEMFTAANYGNADFSEFLSGCKPAPAM